MRGHIHAELMAQYAEDARESERPWERWEFFDCEDQWVQMSGHPLWGYRQYRRKPRTITINGREVPEPMRESPKVGDVVYIVSVSGDQIFFEFPWMHEFMDTDWLSRGLIHSTKEAAIAHAEALLSFTEAK